MKYNINPVQIAKIAGVLRKTGNDDMVRAFDEAVEYWNETLTAEEQYAGEGQNLGYRSYRVDIFVDSAKDYIVHFEIDALRSGLFFKAELFSDIVIQEVAL